MRDSLLLNSESDTASSCSDYTAECALVLQSLIVKHELSDFFEDFITSTANEQRPGSGVAGAPLDRILCANSNPRLGGSNTQARCTQAGTLVCSRCHLVKYCSQVCQRDHAKDHAYDCKSRYAGSEWLPGSKYDSESPYRKEGAPAARSKAIRFPSRPADLPTGCNACLLASSDLNDIVETILSIPDGHTGDLALHVNHLQPHVAFCNFITLLMLGNLGDSSSDLLTQLWYSVAMTQDQKILIAKVFHDTIVFTNLDLNAAILPTMSQLPEVSLKVEMSKDDWCFFGENLFQPERNIGECMGSRRAHLFTDQGKADAVCMMQTLSPYERACWDSFRQTGMLLPMGAFNAHHNIQNELMFDPQNCWKIRCAAGREPMCFKLGGISQCHATTYWEHCSSTFNVRSKDVCRSCANILACKSLSPALNHMFSCNDSVTTRFRCTTSRVAMLTSYQ